MNTTRHENGANQNLRLKNNEAAATQKPTRHVLPKIDLTRRQLVLPNENPELWAQHLAEHMERYRPANEIEREMVEDIAFCRWRLIRSRTLDTALWTIRMEQQKETLANTYTTPTEPARLAHAFATDDAVRNASRYEAHLRRSYNRALRDFQQFRATDPAVNEK